MFTSSHFIFKKTYSIALGIYLLLSLFSNHVIGQIECPSALEHVLLVGPYSSGKELAPLVKERGLIPIALVPSTNPEGYQYNVSDFDWIETYQADENELLDRLLSKGPNLKAIIAASEWNPIITDSLRTKLRNRGIELVGNSHLSSSARRDKIAFYQALDRAGIETSPWFHSSEIAELKKWTNAQNGTVVVKAPREAGTDKVFFISSGDRLDSIYPLIVNGRPNSMLEIDTEVVLQKKISGQEYAINGMVINGQVFVTGMWRYERKEAKGAATVYVADRLMFPTHEMWRELTTLTEKVIKAVEYENGPFHLESIGLIPIDFGARFSGGGLPFLERVATNRNPFDLTLDTHLAPKKALAKLRLPYEVQKHAASVFISSTHEGAIASHEIKSDLEALKQRGIVLSYELFHQHGASLHETSNSDSTVANILITAESEEALEAQISEFMQWQASGRFELTQ